MPKVCENCGADPFKVWDYDHLVKEKLEISDRFKKASAQHGLSRAEWTLKEIELTEAMKFLQRKTKKQAEALQKLEEKLIKLKQLPYKVEVEPENPVLGDTRNYNTNPVRLISKSAAQETKYL